MGWVLRTLLFAFVAAGVLPATALGVDGDSEVTFTVPLRADHGLSAKLEADDDEIELTVRKEGQQAVYSAPGEVSADGIAVTFGALGEFVVDCKPFRTLETREPNRHCTGDPRTITEGFFRGTLRFEGEDGYVHIEAARVKGTLVLQPPWDCDYGRAGVSRRARKRADNEATLDAFSRRDRVRFAVLGSRGEEERPYTVFIASGQEVREGVAITRFTLGGTRSAAGFEFNNRRGTAFVDPPAPFGGSAHYRRRPHAPDRWSGPLTAPLLGLGRVHIAGPGFVARMVPRLLQFE